MSIEEVQRKLVLAEHNAERYRKLAALPTLSLRAAFAAHQLARSYAAAVKLYRKALTYERIREAVRVQRQGRPERGVGEIWVESPSLQP